MDSFFSFDEQAAASAISIMNQQQQQQQQQPKRDREEDGADAAGGMRPAKMARPASVATVVAAVVATETAVVAPLPILAAPRSARPSAPVKEVKPAPYFYYREHSMEVDDDPLTPLTPPGRVPNFPAKMHAILSRPDLGDIVSWLPHGRSWRVLKPREFEVKVIPLFFEHAKFSSFVRQANGWGFRRITQGKDRNSYYHEMFLRGLPHLCKSMKRPGVSEKKTADPEHEPGLYAISEMNPLPDKVDDDSILLHCTVQGGPKARMPIYTGPTMASHSTPMPGFMQSMSMSNAPVSVNHVFQPMKISPVATVPKPAVTMPAMSFLGLPHPTATTTLAAAPQQQQQQAAAAPAATPAFAAFHPMAMPGMDPAAASQFAAGFAAATAFSQQHFNSVLGNLAKQQQQQQ